MDDPKQKVWSAVLIFLISATAAYLAMEWLTSGSSTPAATPSRSGFYDPEPVPEPNEWSASILTPEKDLSPGLIAARQELADRTFMPGSVGDKLYNLLSSDKTDYSRELYTFLHDFPAGSGQLTAELREELNQLAAVLRAYPELVIQLDVHTDDQGGRSAMRSLSQKQAARLKSFLVNADIPGDAIEVMGMGSDVPLTTNTNEASRAQNRRIEMSLRAR